jgi:hypothetical protein
MQLAITISDKQQTALTEQETFGSLQIATFRQRLSAQTRTHHSLEPVSRRGEKMGSEQRVQHSNMK